MPQKIRYDHAAPGNRTDLRDIFVLRVNTMDSSQMDDEAIVTKHLMALGAGLHNITYLYE